MKESVRHGTETTTGATGRTRSIVWPTTGGRRLRRRGHRPAGRRARSRASASCGRRRFASGWTAARRRPREVIATWKERFPTFWPTDVTFYAPLAGIAPGEVALLEIAPLPGAPVRLSTGVMVLYADDESFTFMTPEGHTLSAWITFSAYRRRRRDGRPGPGARAAIGPVRRSRLHARGKPDATPGSGRRP